MVYDKSSIFVAFAQLTFVLTFAWIWLGVTWPCTEGSVSNPKQRRPLKTGRDQYPVYQDSPGK